MRITESQLRRFIAEEISRLLEVDENQGLQEVAEAIRLGDSISGEVAEGMKERMLVGNLNPNFDQPPTQDSGLIELLARHQDRLLEEYLRSNPQATEVPSDIKQQMVSESSSIAATEWKRLHPESDILNSYIDEISDKSGINVRSIAPPSWKEFAERYAYELTYMFVFGFIDNLVLIIAASVLDVMLIARFGATGTGALVAGGYGNLISDVMGDIFGASVESMLKGTDLAERMATDEQMELATPFQQMLVNSASTVGVALGCIAGLKVGLMIVKGVGTAALAGSLMGSGGSGGQQQLFRTTARQAWKQALRSPHRVVTSFEGVAAATITGATITVASVATLVAAGFLGYGWHTMQTALNEMTKSSLESGLGIVRNRLHKIWNTEYPDDHLGRGEFTEERFLSMLDTNREDVQRIWNEEMSIARSYSGNPDINKNMVWEFVKGMSEALGLDDPNENISLDEARWLKIAGIHEASDVPSGDAFISPPPGEEETYSSEFAYATGYEDVDPVHNEIVSAVFDRVEDTALLNMGVDRRDIVLGGLDNEMEAREEAGHELDFSEIDLKNIVNDVMIDLAAVEKQQTKKASR